MLLILDVDYTLNCFYPPSVHDLAPPELLGQEGPALWAWLIEHLSTVEYPVREQAVEVLGWLNACAPKVVVSTGRPEALRDVTERWLRRWTCIANTESVPLPPRPAGRNSTPGCGTIPSRRVFEPYWAAVQNRHPLRPRRTAPTGWCSWACEQAVSAGVRAARLRWRPDRVREEGPGFSPASGVSWPDSDTALLLPG